MPPCTNVFQSYFIVWASISRSTTASIRGQDEQYFTSEAIVIFFLFVTLWYNIILHLLHASCSLHRGIFPVGASLTPAGTVFKHILNNSKLLSSQFGVEKYHLHLTEMKEEIKPLSLHYIRNKCQVPRAQTVCSSLRLHSSAWIRRVICLLYAWWLKSLYIMLSLR